jgi:hypothetical protein
MTRKLAKVSPKSIIKIRYVRNTARMAVLKWGRSSAAAADRGWFSFFAGGASRIDFEEVRAEIASAAVSTSRWGRAA